MKTIVIVPVKSISKRIKGKNFKIVGGKPLYTYLLDKLSYCNFDEVYVDSDSNEINQYCKKKNYTFIQRLPRLAKDSANGNHLINHHAEIVKADLYFQLFITSPFLSIQTINNCIKILKTKKNIDSIFTAKKIYSWFWFNNKPVNYNPKILPRSQDAKPIIMETTGLYGIKSNALKKMKCRIGKKPFIYFLESSKESLDIDTTEDIKLFKYFQKK